MTGMEFVDKKTIRLDKEINLLDEFVFEFLDVLEKISEYVIVSGYVAILLGRSRATEDVDVLVPHMGIEKFKEMHDGLIGAGFWFINSEDIEDLYAILEERQSIRAVKGEGPYPNVEIKFLKDELDDEALNKKICVEYGGRKVFTAPIELQVAYKEILLGSQKDLEDAKHLELTLKDFIDTAKLNEYRKQMKDEIQRERN